MHAVVVTVNIDPAHVEEAQARLATDVLPMVKQLPGVISGYWLVPTKEGRGSSMILFDSEQAGQSAADGLPKAPMPGFIAFDTIEVREVAGHI